MGVDFDHAKNPLILQTKMEEVKDYTHTILFQFPKKERYQLCAEIENTVNAALHEIIRFEKKFYKKTTLQEIDIELEYLRVLIRQARKEGYISVKRLGVWMSKVDEAGRLLCGLVRHFRAVAEARETSKKK